ncbi:gamma-glutamyltransferase family protein [Rhodocaloribacter sp.]
MRSLLFTLLLLFPMTAFGQRTAKPVLHGRHWVAITGKPLGATAGAAIFQKGGNAVDAACAMLAATSTMWDVLSWGGETQALIYNPHTGKVVGINALGVAPTGATAEFFKEQGMKYPPEFGPLAAVTPGTPGGLMVMLAEYGTMRLADVLAPAMEMAEGYPIEAQTADRIEREKERIKQWKYSREVFLPHLGEEREAPYAGEIFRQPDLRNTLQKLVDAEAAALAEGKTRKEAIYAAYDRFYKGDIAEELVRAVQEEGGLITMEDLANWQVHVEEPVMTTYKGIEVYKLTSWVQGPVMLQMLNMLENFDLKAMGYNSARYIHTLYQVMNRAFADRDFYYGDPYFPPEEPLEGLLSKEYAKARIRDIDWEKNDPAVKPGDPYPFQGGTNPYLEYLERWAAATPVQTDDAGFADDFYAGTTSIEATDEEGWVVSVTPSGGWVPAVIAGRTGVGLSQRMQSFVLDPAENPFNVVEPGKRPRATLTPGLALKDGKPYLSFAVQGGDSQDQNLLQFFLNVVEFGMNVQEAAEAANVNSFQLHGSFGEHESRPGRLLIQEATPPWVRKELRAMGYELRTAERTSGPINAIFFDWKHGSFWGGSSHHGEDYGIAW